MIKTALLILLMPLILQGKSFVQEQNRYKRPRAARKTTIQSIKKLFKEKKIPYPAPIFFRMFKLEKRVELYAKKGTQYQLVKTYPFCMLSGVLGPKRHRGDLQVPEGFYHIFHFNPFSNYHLSMGISYPNRSDKIKKTPGENPGGSIYFHGDCVSIGCIPITDDLIKEAYTISVDAKNMGQKKIPVHLFPCDFKTTTCQKEMKKHPQHHIFWENLKPGYNYFEKYHKIPKIRINKKGDYWVKKK